MSNEYQLQSFKVNVKTIINVPGYWTRKMDEDEEEAFLSCVLQYFDVHTKYVYRVEDNALIHVFIL